MDFILNGSPLTDLVRLANASGFFFLPIHQVHHVTSASSLRMEGLSLNRRSCRSESGVGFQIMHKKRSFLRIFVSEVMSVHEIEWKTERRVDLGSFLMS